MNGVHDLGGLEGFGPVNPTPSEPVFHSEWEANVFGMAFPALLAGINLDEFRASIERMHPVEYLSSRYYEHWFHVMERELTQRGVIDGKELEDRIATYRADPDHPLPQRDDQEQVALFLGVHRGGVPSARPEQGPARYRPGDQVRVKNEHPSGHTRATRYVRGKHGTVARAYGAFVFPDTNARGEGENPAHLYSVAFPAAELWGADAAEPNQVVYVDCFEPYLEEVTA